MRKECSKIKSIDAENAALKYTTQHSQLPLLAEQLHLRISLSSLNDRNKQQFLTAEIIELNQAYSKISEKAQTDILIKDIQEFEHF